MTYEFIIVETHDRVGLVRLNRPKALNALNSAVINEAGQAFTAFDNDPAIGALVLTGSDKAFAAGADIKQMAKATLADVIKNDPIEEWSVIGKLTKPLIAAVSGYAFGGGCEVAMMCDMIVASETAIFGQPEINLGIIPGAGGTQRLIRAVGKALAMEMILNDRRLSAAEAYQFGLVNRVYPVESYLEEALKLANEIAARAPLAVQLAKEAIDKAYEMTLAEGLNFERHNFQILFGTEDQAEGMDAFINKRPPNWTGQ